MEPLIDEARLQDISDGDESALRELVQIFLNDTTGELQKLDDAVTSRNAAEIHRISHGIAGAAMTYGMSGMIAPLRELEAEAKAGRLDQAPALRTACRESFQKIQAHFLQLFI